MEILLGLFIGIILGWIFNIGKMRPYNSFLKSAEKLGFSEDKKVKEFLEEIRKC